MLVPAARRVSNLDIFGILLPGFYMLASMSVVVISYSSQDSASSPNETFSRALSQFKELHINVLALVASYLLGNIPRAFVVGPTDRLCNYLPWWFRRVSKTSPDSWKTIVRNARDFPYVTVLKRSLGKLKTCERNATSGILLPGKNDPGAVAAFDYWKHILALHAPPLFAIAEQLEARVRFFVGMFWAAAVGVTCAILTLVSLPPVTGFVDLRVIHLCMSAVMLLLFGVRLRFVRAEEATQVLLAYVAHKASADGSGSQVQNTDTPTPM